jgi:BirA family biotin operon repressor/biotin-[acetyl-CoA-carboxylase] ligase
MGAEQPDRLDAGQIRRSLRQDTSAILRQLTLLDEVDSTNDWLSRLPADQQHAHAVLADAQTDGRGRRHKDWFSPAGGNVYFSLGWRFEHTDAGLATLPLLAGIALCRALATCGLEGHGIKWPNDVLVQGEKLAGILVEMQSAPEGPALAVIGAGINVRMPPFGQAAAGRRIDRPWTDLAASLPADRAPPERNRLTAALLNELLVALADFQRDGFEPFRSAWQDWDLLQGQQVELDLDNRTLAGKARGVDHSGGLRLEQQDGTIKVFHSGEVSVRRG